MGKINHMIYFNQYQVLFTASLIQPPSEPLASKAVTNNNGKIPGRAAKRLMTFSLPHWQGHREAHRIQYCACKYINIYIYIHTYIYIYIWTLQTGHFWREGLCMSLSRIGPFPLQPQFSGTTIFLEPILELYLTFK